MNRSLRYPRLHRIFGTIDVDSTAARMPPHVDNWKYARLSIA